MVYVFLAEGFEEVEALATVDIIRRAGVECVTVGVTGKTVTGAHNIPVLADTLISDIDIKNACAVVLPGGMPGTLNLEGSSGVIDAVKYAYDNNLLIAAICAAPSVLGHLNMLVGKTATCYDGFEKELIGARLSDEPVCTDGNIITACGAGAALDFGAQIVAYLKDEKTAQTLKKAMKCR